MREQIVTGKQNYLQIMTELALKTSSVQSMLVYTMNQSGFLKNKIK